MFSSSASLQFEQFCAGQAGEAGTSYLETKIISPCFKQGAAQPLAAESSKGEISAKQILQQTSTYHVIVCHYQSLSQQVESRIIGS